MGSRLGTALDAGRRLSLVSELKGIKSSTGLNKRKRKEIIYQMTPVRRREARAIGTC